MNFRRLVGMIKHHLHWESERVRMAKMVTLYRGINHLHPSYHLACSGIVVPQNRYNPFSKIAANTKYR